MKILVVTSWSPIGYELYGKRFLDTASRWPNNMELHVVSDQDLAEMEEFRSFMDRHADRKMDPSLPGYDYRQDLCRFAHKIFALKSGLKRALEFDFDYLIWLDGDTETIQEPTKEFLAEICPEDQDGALLSRVESAPHPECGFMSFNLRRLGADFLHSFIGFYESDKVLELSELHDSHAFMAMVVAHSGHRKSDWKDLCPKGVGPYGLDAFEGSILNAFFVHKKGNRKVNPSNAEIVEWLLGDRVDRHLTVSEAKKRIRLAANETVVLDCDMAPIEDVKEALVSLKDRRVIYRGFYSSDSRGNHVDTTRYGINNARSDLVVFESIEIAKGGGFIHIAVPKDQYPQDCPLPVFTQRQMQAVTQEAAKQITNNAYQTNMLVQTQNCVPVEQIQANIRANLGLVSKWMPTMRPHRQRAVVVSAGPSLDMPETIEAIRNEIDAGAKVICVKHSHQKLLDSGIVPWACVLLDPRPHEGISTHGSPRAELLPKADPRVRYFVASMVDPGVVQKLQKTGGQVWGYHAAVGADEVSIIPEEHRKFMIGGGSSSAGRAMILAWQLLGFSSIGLYGFDSCHLDHEKLDKGARHQDGTPKYFEMEVAVGGAKKSFWTDRDILCQAQDFTRLLKETPWIHWDAHGPGMVAWLWKNSKGALPRLDEVFK